MCRRVNVGADSPNAALRSEAPRPFDFPLFAQSNSAGRLTAATLPTWRAAPLAHRDRRCVRSEGRARRIGETAVSAETATTLRRLAAMLLRIRPPDRNDGGGAPETALRPGVSRPSVRLPYARPSVPEIYPRRHRQRAARPDGLAAIGSGSACQLRSRGTTPTRALRRWRIAPLPRPLRDVSLFVPTANPQQRRLPFVGSWASLPIPLHA